MFFPLYPLPVKILELYPHFIDEKMKPERQRNPTLTPQHPLSRHCFFFGDLWS